MRGGGAESDNRFRLDQGDLGVEPHATRLDFAVARLLVYPSLAARFPLEMLDDVREVDVLGIDARFFERASQQLTGWTNEWPTLHVLDVARLLADQHETYVARTLAEHGLGRATPEVAAA